MASLDIVINININIAKEYFFSSLDPNKLVTSLV